MKRSQIKFDTDISKIILKIAWPAMLEQLLACMASLVDTVMVGSLGAVATASVAVNVSLVWVANGLMGALGTGFSYMVARSVIWGAGNGLRQMLDNVKADKSMEIIDLLRV